ncbi:MAG: formylmethanofuran dehydrogenase subunit A [Synergistales bacterium]|nr:formylmethanofuran dehydrogenase subunit A [Synergistales bacterium]
MSGTQPVGILGGFLYDPANGVDGAVRDIWIKDGRVAAPEEVDREHARIIDARGMNVFPGGVDLHAHIAGAKVNHGRKLCPEDHADHKRNRAEGGRSGAGFTVPTTFMTGCMYAELGYTTVMEAACAPLVARHTHEELEDMPLLDKGILVTLGNNEFLFDCIARGETERARDFIAWTLQAARGYGIKVVNPGGVENWKSQRGNAHHWDQEIAGFGLTPRRVLDTLIGAADELGLPHGVHLHGLNLGTPQSAEQTLESIRFAQGRLHLTHLQFMSYGDDGKGRFRSRTEELAEAVNANSNVTFDVGQIVFGPATTMTSDGPFQYNLGCMTGHKWFGGDEENETGGGIVPLRYSRKNRINALQWVTGLELFLLAEDPWRVALTTDHPNAGPFFCYPQVIRLLMDRDYRAEILETLPASVRKRSLLKDIDREYTLGEIAIITRAAPARILGLSRKGHLGVGADGDVAVYHPDDDGARTPRCRSVVPCRRALDLPRWVLKGGRVVVEAGRFTGETGDAGTTFHVTPDYDPSVEKPLRNHFKRYYSVAFDNYPVQDAYLGSGESVPCR